MHKPPQKNGNRRPMTTARRIQQTLCLALLAFLTYLIVVNSVIGILIATGTSRGHSEKITADTETACREYQNDLHPFTRHIHQMWNTPDVPEKFRTAVDSCRKLNPGYNYTLWVPHQRRAFIHKYYPWFLPTYDGYSQEIMRLDVTRYFILHHYGGVYLDIDIECKTSFDVIVKNTTAGTGVLHGATIPSGIGTYWSIGKRGHPYLRYIGRRLVEEDRWYGLPYMTVLVSTGPIFLWRAYSNYPCKEQVYIVDTDTHQQIYFRHFHLSSWHSWDGMIFIFFDKLIKAVMHAPSYAWILAVAIAMLAISVAKSRDKSQSQWCQEILPFIYKNNNNNNNNNHVKH